MLPGADDDDSGADVDKMFVGEVIIDDSGGGDGDVGICDMGMTGRDLPSMSSMRNDEYPMDVGDLSSCDRERM